MPGDQHNTNPRVPTPFSARQGSEATVHASLPQSHIVAGKHRDTLAKPQHDFRDQLSNQASARVVFIGVGGGCVARFIHFPFHGGCNGD